MGEKLPTMTITEKQPIENAASSELALAEEGTSNIGIDPEAEKKLVRKMDMFILPVIFVTYVLSFLDRSNIGNAKVAGLPADLHLHGSQINMAVSIFYVTYILFEFPGTMLLKVVGPSKFIPILICSWSLVVTFSGFQKNVGSLVACRLLLGMCEAALLPSLNLYISMFWKREEIAKRSSVIFVSITISGAFGGLFAYALLQLDGVGGYESWRWLFFIEGAISFAWGICAFFLYPDNPSKAYFLNAKEKELAHIRLEPNADSKVDWVQVKAAFTSPICWLSGVIQMFADVYNYSISVFLPTIIQGIGYKGLSIQYMTIPIYVIGALGIFGFAAISDRIQRRAPIMLSGSLLTVIGYSLLLGTKNADARYFACYLVVLGGNVLPCLNIIWINGNTAFQYKRGTALAMNQIIGNIGGVVSGQIYLTNESPYYTTGQSVALACCLSSWLCVWIMLFVLSRRNRDKARKIRDGIDDTGLGDESIYFKYQL